MTQQTNQLHALGKYLRQMLGWLSIQHTHCHATYALALIQSAQTNEPKVSVAASRCI